MFFRCHSLIRTQLHTQTDDIIEWQKNNSSRTWARSPSYLYSQTNSALPNLCITSWIPFVGWASIGFSGMPCHATKCSK